MESKMNLYGITEDNIIQNQEIKIGNEIKAYIFGKLWLVKIIDIFKEPFLYCHCYLIEEVNTQEETYTFNQIFKALDFLEEYDKEKYWNKINCPSDDYISKNKDKLQCYLCPQYPSGAVDYTELDCKKCRLQFALLSTSKSDCTVLKGE
jgi:hypothetical protein